MKVGLLADIHGDYEGFRTALSIFKEESVEAILCAGDIVDRGPAADAVAAEIKARGIPTIKGNHEHTVIANQDKWRSRLNKKRLRQVGRIINDETLAFIKKLPETRMETIAGVRIAIAHGTPWSNLIAIFHDTNPKMINHVIKRTPDEADVLLLGHSHHPLWLKAGHLTIVNPGSVYGVTRRDSHTCGLLHLGSKRLEIVSLKTRQRVPLAPVDWY